MNLNDFLPVDDESDIYVLGFQEIVPLNAGNLLVTEVREPASKWICIVDQSLNRVNFSSKDESSEEEEEDDDEEQDDQSSAAALSSQDRYIHIVSKQMVGIFVTVWAKKELVHYVSHLQISSVSRGIMGQFGNKGCVSVSMSLHQTTLCFICSHLASGEKEGDELRRNSDVKEILKNTRFRRACRNRRRRNPEKIIDHDRVIWLGDLNYRIALSYLETKKLLEDNNWDALLEKDQLRTEREAGRVFKGWKEGKIYFAPTYKYSDNSDSYSGENSKSKKKRRTPAWCDRILWHGDNIIQLSYVRGESRLSDHRPVFAVFSVEVEVIDDRLRKDLSASNMKVGVEELLPSPKHSFHEKHVSLQTDIDLFLVASSSSPDIQQHK
ncbi:Type I inositol 1,4,5-trisphosphate 5-phosphatase CVP2 [Apostasia shenzhenica]|uniref:Type I inositol 1,4,5-trisphosphate 5-phosphatase CVP2 n=1 Tax=Apostasia shenzhenica TaxID=1088818 RepID=A0A2I0B211_9ASPA|nr:Type I inositol 1,4,5-trisphosphate 5-phosphatase CVP2 [Apostasia shenzhenica]